MKDDDLDERCGRYLRFRDLIEVGETWRRVRVPNLPIQPATADALQQLARDILDPVIDEYGPVEITYGFASWELTRHVPGRIAPHLDQHAGHELRPNGKLVCPRLGQAADFWIPGLCSGMLAAWLVAKLPFDRLYFYGPDRPIHVSIGPGTTRAVIAMMHGQDGKRIPRTSSPSWLIEHYKHL